MTHKLNFVSCVAWIRQGVAKELPNRCQLTQEEIRSKIESDRQKFKELKRYASKWLVLINLFIRFLFTDPIRIIVWRQMIKMMTINK